MSASDPTLRNARFRNVRDFVAPDFMIVSSHVAAFRLFAVVTTAVLLLAVVLRFAI